MRLTECPLGQIRHRPDTRLTPPRRCDHGHRARFYLSTGKCAACAKIRTYAALGAAETGRVRIRYHEDYEDALARHKLIGGWLLRLEAGFFLTTDQEGTVVGRRGAGWVKRCERLRCWNEVELLRRQRRQGRGA